MNTDTTAQTAGKSNSAILTDDPQHKHSTAVTVDAVATTCTEAEVDATT